MKFFETMDTMLGRMTPRERRLTGILVAALLVIVVAGGWVASMTFFGSIQADIDHGREVMAQLRQAAPRYLEVTEDRKRIEDAIRANRQSVRALSNELLKQIELSATVQGATGNSLADIVSFEGKTSETPIEQDRKKKATSKAKGKETAGIIQVEQNLEFREVPVMDLIRFLDAVEKSKDLIFVTKTDMTRKFNDKANVRATIAIATYIYSGEAEQSLGSVAGPAD